MNRQIISPSDSLKLNVSELSIAKIICDYAIISVDSREKYINENNIDKLFALPDANWLLNEENDFLRMYRRISKCNHSDLQNLRVFTPYFSGFNLYDVEEVKEANSPSRRVIDSNTAARVVNQLTLRNLPYVEYWRRTVENIPREYVLRPPMMFGECGDMIDDAIVNHDTLAYQTRANLIYEFGLTEWIEDKIRSTGKIRILEIGGGYGAFAYWFKRAFPRSAYTICDLPESLLFSRLYLTLAMPDVQTAFGLETSEYGFRFTPNYMLEGLKESFDLVINTLSFSEMSSYQVNKYADLIKKFITPSHGLLFEQNQNNKHLGFVDAQDIFSDYFQHRINICNPLVHGNPNVWSNHEIKLIPKPTFIGLNNENLRHIGSNDVFNLIQVGNVYFCINKEINLEKINVTSMPRKSIPPYIYFGYTAESALQLATDNIS